MTIKEKEKDRSTHRLVEILGLEAKVFTKNAEKGVTRLGVAGQRTILLTKELGLGIGQTGGFDAES